MNTLLDLVYVKYFNQEKNFFVVVCFRLESKPISTDLQTNEDNSTLPFIQYDL
jgi:hypothetical protein